MREARRATDPEIVVAASERIQRAVMELPAFTGAGAVGCYLALPYEVQTRRIIERCYRDGKKICVPAFNREKDRYELHWLEEGDSLTPGKFNIREPRSARPAGVMDVDLIVVPALAYDRNGGRLGHGGGHYDRVLGAWSGLKVGVAFEFQIFDQVPMGSQDIPVDLVVTESTIYPSGKAGG